MTEYVPERATPELIALEAKLSAQFPYRQVTAMMREFLPARKTLNHVTVRNRTLLAGKRIDGTEVAGRGDVGTDTEWTLAIDGGFVHGRRESARSSFEVLTGRLAAKGQKPHFFCVCQERVTGRDQATRHTYTNRHGYRPSETFGDY